MLAEHPPSTLVNCFPHQPIASLDNEPLVCLCNAPYRPKLEEEREREEHGEGNAFWQVIWNYGKLNVMAIHCSEATVYKQKQPRDNERMVR